MHRWKIQRAVKRCCGGKRATRGTPQGRVGFGPARERLHESLSEKVFRLRGLDRRCGARLVNYADDFVVLCRSGAAKVLAQSRRWFTQMGLTLNEQKTRVCDGRRGAFTFLGYTFAPMRYRKDGHWYLGAAPAKAAVKRVKGRIRQIRSPGRSSRPSRSGARRQCSGCAAVPPSGQIVCVCACLTEW